MVTAKAVLWISTSQSMMDLLYQCPESCTDQGSAPTSLWKQSTEHYSSVGGKQIWLTSCSSKFSGIRDLQCTHLKGQMDKAVSFLCYLWLVLFPAQWLSKQSKYWFSWWLNIKHYEVTLWNMTLKEISVSQLNAGAATQIMQWTIRKL